MSTTIKSTRKSMLYCPIFTRYELATKIANEESGQSCTAKVLDDFRVRCNIFRKRGFAMEISTRQVYCRRELDNLDHFHIVLQCSIPNQSHAPILESHNSSECRLQSR